VEQFTEQVGHPGRPAPRAVVGDCFSENGRVDQCLTPYREAHGRPTFERRKKILVLDQGDGCGTYCAYGMIHFLDEECLGIRHVAREMKRKVLPLAVRKQMVASDDTR